jgi:hypothetical protein
MTSSALVLSGDDTYLPATTAPTLPAARVSALLIPTSYDEMYRLAKTMHVSNMFALHSPEQAMVVLMTGLELGFSPAQAFRGIHVIKGKPTLSADMMVAVCKSRADICHYFRVVESTDQQAVYQTHRVGEAEPTTNTFSLGDAERAGLLRGNENYQKYGPQMLRARAASGLARMVYPDLMLGLYTPDEIESTPPPARPAPVNVTPGTNVTPSSNNTLISNITPAARQVDNARQAPPAETAPPAEAVGIPETIQERRKLLGLTLAGMSDTEAWGWLKHFRKRFGRDAYGSYTLDECAQAITFLASCQWPEGSSPTAPAKATKEETPKNAAPSPPVDSSGEIDPFDTREPSLLDVPVATQGHGGS